MSNNANILLLITAENKASQVLQQVQEQATQTQDKISQANEKVSQSVQKVERNYLQAGAAFTAVGASVAGFVTSLDNLERAQLKVDIAQKHVNDLIARGKAGTEEYRIAQEKLRLAQDNLNDTYVNFIAGIGPQMFSIIFGLQAGFKALGVTSVSQLIPAIRGVGTALKATFITNPVGIAILGITTVIGLLVFNVGGLRDKIVALGNQILSFIDAHLKPLADAIRFIIDLFKPLGEIFGLVMPQEMSETQNAIEDLQGVAIPSFENMRRETDILEDTIIESFENMRQESLVLGTSIALITDRANIDMAKMAIGVEVTVQRNIENFGRVGRTARDMVGDIAESTADAADIMQQNASVMVDAGNAIASVLGQIRSLQAGKVTDFRTVSMKGGKTIRLKANTRVAEAAERQAGIVNAAIDEQISGLLKRQSELIAGLNIGGLTLGEKILGVGGGGIIGTSGTVFGTGLTQAITPGGTLVSKLGSTFDIGATRVIADARAVLERGFVTRADIIRAQHGFQGIFDRPTFLPLMVGEGGVREQVHVGPANGPMKLIVQFEDSSGNELGSETLDMVNREAIIRIKTRGRRLF